MIGGYQRFGDPRIAGYEATQKTTDYKRIRVGPKYSRLRSIDTAAIHHRSKRRLEEQLERVTEDEYNDRFIPDFVVTV